MTPVSGKKYNTYIFYEAFKGNTLVYAFEANGILYYGMAIMAALWTIVPRLH